MTLSTLMLMETLKGKENSSNFDSLITQFANMMNELIQGEYSNRKAILDAIKSLKKD